MLQILIKWFRNFISKIFHFSYKANNVDSKLQKLLKNFNKEDCEHLCKALKEGHECLKNCIDNKEDISHIDKHSLVQSILDGTHQKNMEKLQQIHKQLPVEHNVDPEGVIIGFGKYEKLDIRWAEALIVLFEHYFRPTDLPDNPPIIPIADEVKIALFGDFGAGIWEGNNAAQKIKNKIISLNTDYAIHIGDVYYAGTEEECKKNLIDFWPTAKGGNFTLNGNHEMLDGGEAYFKTVLTNKIFETQQKNSYFALENSNWLIVCLDSAFFADVKNLYADGKIDPQQIDFLKKLKTKNKNCIVVTHHHPLTMNGENYTDLFHQVKVVLGSQIKYWYYGHRHHAAVYKQINGINFRLSGNAALPYGYSSLLGSSSKTIWYETNKPNPQDGIRLQNGFCMLTLNNDTVKEEFYGENGKINWQSA